MFDTRPMNTEVHRSGQDTFVQLMRTLSCERTRVKKKIFFSLKRKENREERRSEKKNWEKWKIINFRCALLQCTMLCAHKKVARTYRRPNRIDSDFSLGSNRTKTRKQRENQKTETTIISIIIIINTTKGINKYKLKKNDGKNATKNEDETKKTTEKKSKSNCCCYISGREWNKRPNDRLSDFESNEFNRKKTSSCFCFQSFFDAIHSFLYFYILFFRSLHIAQGFVLFLVSVISFWPFKSQPTHR